MIFGYRTNRELREENAELRRIIGDFAKDLKVAQGEISDLRAKCGKCHRLRLAAVDRAHRAEKALSTIARQETPGANATVKRMAKIAREALGEKTE